MQIVYHGTADYVLELIQKSAPLVRLRNYTRRKSFCTTTSFPVASLFAVRKTASGDFHHNRITGIVLEFALAGEQPRDWQPVKDPSCVQEEHEVAVYDVRKLELVAVWRYDTEWKRTPIRKNHGKKRTRTSVRN